MDEFSYEQIARWLAEPTDPIELENWVGNKILGVKVGENKAWELAVLREKIRKIREVGEIRDVGDFIKIIQETTKDEKEILRVLLDVVEPEGIVEIEGIGILIAPVGEVRDVREVKEAKIAMEITIDKGGEKQKLKIPLDEIVVIPGVAGGEIKLEIKLKEGLKIDKKTSIKFQGLSERIIIDTRGRPLNLPTADLAGRERIKKWQKALE